MSEESKSGGSQGVLSRVLKYITPENIRTTNQFMQSFFNTLAQFNQPLYTGFYFIMNALAMVFLAVIAVPVTFGWSAVLIPLLMDLVIPLVILGVISMVSMPLIRMAVYVKPQNTILKPVWDLVLFMTIGLPFALPWWWAGRILAFFLTSISSLTTTPTTAPVCGSVSSFASSIAYTGTATIMNAVRTSLDTIMTSPRLMLPPIYWKAGPAFSLIPNATNLIPTLNTCLANLTQPTNPMGDVGLGIGLSILTVAGGFLVARLAGSRRLGGIGYYAGFVIGAAVVSSLILVVVSSYSITSSIFSCLFGWVYSGSSPTPLFTVGDMFLALSSAGLIGMLVLLGMIMQIMLKVPGFPKYVPISWNLVALMIAVSAFAGSLWFLYAMAIVAIYLAMLWLASGDPMWFYYMIIFVPGSFVINNYFATVSAFLITNFSPPTGLLTAFSYASIGVLAVFLILGMLVAVIAIFPTLASANPVTIALAAFVIGALLVAPQIIASAMSGMVAGVISSQCGQATVYQILTSTSI